MQHSGLARFDRVVHDAIYWSELVLFSLHLWVGQQFGAQAGKIGHSRALFGRSAAS
jgi:hypothetical protein